MKFVIVIACAFLVCVHISEGKDFTFGSRANNLLISTNKVKYRSLPLIRRDKDFAYIDPKERIIKGIVARDLSRTDTEVTITEGGIGANNVTLHFHSGRGQELNYLASSSYKCGNNAENARGTGRTRVDGKMVYFFELCTRTK